MKENNKESFLRLLQSEDKENVNLAIKMATEIPDFQRLIDNCIKVFHCLMADAEEDHIFWTSTIFGEEVPPSDFTEQIMFFNKQSNNHSFQYVEEIPPEIAEMTYFQHLEKLGITHGEVKIIPPEIGQLINLKELNVGYNEIKMISAEIGSLKSLRSLDVSNNQIEFLPSEIGHLSKLSFLNVSKNPNLNSLPKSAQNLQNLQLLFLEDCNFSEQEIQKIKSWLPNCEVKF